MRRASLIRQSLVHYWRINLAVIAGVATAVAVLAGALIVGDSVRASLRDLALERLGQADHAVLSSGFFRDQLAEDLQSHARFASAFDSAAPLIILEGFVTDQASGRRASHVQVYGIDERFWRFHGLGGISAPDSTEAMVSEGLAGDIGLAAGGSILLRVQNPSAIPIESLHGRKEDVGRTVRLSVRQVLTAGQLGEFSLSQQQGSISAVFVPLQRMQLLLDQPSKVNALLIADRPAPSGAGVASPTEPQHEVLETLVRETTRLEDLGLHLRALDQQVSLVLESDSTVISQSEAAAAQAAAHRLGLATQPVFTYLANSLRSGDRSIPYSVVTALDLKSLSAGVDIPEALSPQPGVKSIILNTWAANDLGVKSGDPVSLDYYVWEEEGRLSTRSADFRVAGIVPIEGAAADRDLVPDYPGITKAQRLSQWDPPFPIDLGRVRPVDEAYWNRYRTIPKAFVSLETGQELWRSRYGAMTQLRLPVPAPRELAGTQALYEKMLRAEIDPLAQVFSVYDVRAQSLAASGGATDFGEYFTYFSLFLVFSALLLAALFFKLGVEQRLREIGLLQALGLNPAAVGSLFLGEALVLSLLGGLAGIVGAVAYGAAIMYGLRTWWLGAVGTTALSLHVGPSSLISGALSGVVVAAACIWWTLRSLRGVSARSLLAGDQKMVREPWSSRAGKKDSRSVLAAGAFALLAVVLIGGVATQRVGQVGGFFGAGASALLAMLCWAAIWLRRGRTGALQGHGLSAVWRLGWRNATNHPARSVLCIALIASATFVIVAVEAFKRDDSAEMTDRHAGSGGYPLFLESLLPIVHDLNSPSGRDALNLTADEDLQGVRFDRFRVRPGDNTSCLNLYQPRNPRILSASPDFVAAGRFAFQSSMAQTDAERANPWLLLNRAFPDSAIPVVTDANSMTYVLHVKLGDDIVLPGSPDRPVRLRIVAALSDSIFQGELLMAESSFVRTFPEHQGYRFFLLDAPPARAGVISQLLETRLTDFGVDAGLTSQRLAGFHRVEYTYLSTFQMLGGLGLLLGTLGLGAVLLRNVLERRRELALLRALGYRQADFFAMVIAENMLLLLWGLTVGALCAVLAIAPMFLDRGGRPPGAAIAWLLLGVLVTGLMASLGATAAALRSPLLPALRAE